MHGSIAPVSADAFRVKWMSRQLQSGDLAPKRYWSWTDGVSSPVPTHDESGGYELCRSRGVRRASCSVHFGRFAPVI